jgi:YhcH/YjgK/YiaL family protein
MLPPGDHALGRDGLRCIAAAGETTPAEDPRLEYHRAHIDVHVVLEGREVYGYRPREACEEGPYDADADAAVLTSVAMDLVTVTPGYFVVFFPEDGHRSMLHREGDAEPVRKLVFKLPIPRPGGA